MSTDPASTGVDQVAPPSPEHWYRYADTPGAVTGVTLIRKDWSRASTDGFPGASGRPIGATAVAAAVHAPSAADPIAATSHWYVAPFVSPSTTALVSSDTPSFASIHSPAPARQRAR